jgi:hypothetical protein
MQDSQGYNVRASSLTILFVVAIALIAGTYFSLATSSTTTCNTALSNEADSPPNLCLRSIKIDYSSSSANVPALIMKPGSSATISILYEPHSDAGSGFNPQSKLTGFNIPTPVSAISGNPNESEVRFSRGILLSSHDNWTIYSYNVTASNYSSGYYAIIVPFGPQLYPALVISNDSNSINASMMALWGYEGSITTGETVYPSVFVGTSNLVIENVTVPVSQYCQSRACNLIASSEYYEG